LRLAVARVVADVRRGDGQVDRWVRAAFGPERLRLAEAA
jgi:hypothetical protein